MDDRKLRVFLRSAELGSLSAAGEDLGYTPSAISQLIASLEQELGMQLLIRSSRGVSVTQEASGLIPLIRDHLDHEKLILQYIADIKGLSSGTLNIAAYPSVAAFWLPDIVGQFKKDFPDVRISILECIRSDLFRHLDNQDADLGFLVYAEPMPYEWIPLAEEQLLAVLPESHPLADSASYPIRQIEKDDFILSSWGHEPEILNMLDKYDIHPEIRFTTYDTPVNLAMVRGGLGVSIVNGLSSNYWSDNLVKLPLDPPEKVTFGVAFSSYDNMSTAARTFLDYAVKKLTRSEQL